MAVVMTSKRAGASPKGEIDLLTLVNSGHDTNMGDTQTSIKFRQFYHDSEGVHAPYGSASITLPERRSIFSVILENLHATWAVWQSSTGA